MKQHSAADQVVKKKNWPGDLGVSVEMSCVNRFARVPAVVTRQTVCTPSEIHGNVRYGKI